MKLLEMKITMSKMKNRLDWIRPYQKKKKKKDEK